MLFRPVKTHISRREVHDAGEVSKKPSSMIHRYDEEQAQWPVLLPFPTSRHIHDHLRHLHELYTYVSHFVQMHHLDWLHYKRSECRVDEEMIALRETLMVLCSRHRRTCSCQGVLQQRLRHPALA